MASEIEQRMWGLGIELPEPSAPGANYVPFLREGNLLFNTGQLSQWNGERRFVGKVGQAYDLDEGRETARLAALNVIAHLRSALDGDLDRVERCLRIAIYVNSDPAFHGQSQVANGASDLVLEIFGEVGRHTRMAVGVAALPYDVAAEVEGVFSVR
jgi:enamine deaminase RidA (YjgF/YER057c/UK114 family)